MSAPVNRLYLLYHELRELPSDYSYALEVSEFERHADFFAQARSDSQQMLRPEITFDDGHISNYDLALPVLVARGLQATFFITVGWTGARAGYMGWEQLRALQAAGQRIGAHGWTHTLLTHCDDAALRLELGKARTTLEDKLGTSITTMSLPGGRFDTRILHACREAGYTQVFTSVPGIEVDSSAPLLGRLNVRSTMKVDWLARLLDPDSGVLARLERHDRWKHAMKKTVGDRFYEKLWAVFNRREMDAAADEISGR